MTARPYDWRSLEELLGGEVRAKRALKVDHRQVADYRARGITERRADTLAGLAGYHPLEVWPWWGADVDEARRLRANAVKRRWRRTPAGRASELRSQQKWREECREYKRARDRETAAARDRERKREIDRAYWARNRAAILERRRRAA